MLSKDRTNATQYGRAKPRNHCNYTEPVWKTSSFYISFNRLMLTKSACFDFSRNDTRIVQYHGDPTNTVYWRIQKVLSALTTTALTLASIPTLCFLHLLKLSLLILQQAERLVKTKQIFPLALTNYLCFSFSHKESWKINGSQGQALSLLSQTVGSRGASASIATATFTALWTIPWFFGKKKRTLAHPQVMKS